LLRDNYISHYKFYHLDTAKLTGEAINLIKKYNPSKVGVDCDGIGAGVYDNLNEAVSAGIIDTELIEIHGGAVPTDLGQTEDFLNLRAQMYWLLRQDMETLAIEPDDDVLEGLSTIKYFFNSKGKIQIESKDDIRKRLGRSPDIEDAIAYANYLKYTKCGAYSISEGFSEDERYKRVTERVGV
jgi:phage terminase large subunit